MKAAVLYGNEDIRYDDYPTPQTKPGTVKIRVRASGICGSDIPRVLHNGAHFFPIVLGHEFAGDVVEVGEGVTNVAVGDTVSGAPLVPCMTCADCQQGNYALCRHYSFIGSREQGSFAEYVVIPARNAIRYDPAIPYEQAAMFEPAAVALHGLMCNAYRGGGYTAILGGGTIGMFAAQWARIFGGRKVVVFDLLEERMTLARALGADATINTRDPDFMEQANAITGGHGFDDVFETAGSTDTIRMAFTLAANRARVCCIGTPHADMTFTPELWERMNRKEFTLTGSWMSYSAPYPGKEWQITADCFADGRLRFSPDLIYRTFPLSQAAEAFALYKTPGAVKGKIMLVNER